MADPIILVTDLTAAYENTVILKNVSFSVSAGDVFVILGGSGCGKSTLLQHLIGLRQPKTGSILIDGDDLANAGETRKAAIMKKIGVMFQSGALFGSMTLLENVCLPLEVNTDLPADARETIAHLKLRQVGLGDFACHFPAEISGGMRKRAAIARAMALGPAIVFLDEPSAGLDPVTSAALDRLIVDISREQGTTFVIVSHELASIHAIATRAIMLDREASTIIASGHPDTLKATSQNPKVRAFFHRLPGNDTTERTSE